MLCLTGMANKLFKSILILSIITFASLQSLQVSGNTYADALWVDGMETTDVAISTDGKFIAAINFTSLVFFASNSSTPLWWYVSPNANFTSVAISSDGNQVVAGNNSGRIHYWNNSMSGVGDVTPTWSSIPLSNVTQPIVPVDISANGNHVAVGATNDTGYATLYYFNDCKTRSTASEEPTWDDLGYFLGWVTSVDISPNGTYLAVGLAFFLGGGIVSFWDDANQVTPNKLWQYGFNSSSGVVVQLSDDGYAVASSDSKNVRYWKDALNLTDSPQPSWYANASQQKPFDPSSMDMSADGNIVIAGQSNASLICWKNARNGTGQFAASWKRLQNPKIVFDNCVISDNGEIIVAATFEGSGGIFTPPHSESYFYNNDGELLGSYGYGYFSMNQALSISGDGGLVAVGTAYRSLHVLNLEEQFSYKYFKEVIGPYDDSPHLVAQIHPLPGPKKVSIYVELEPDEKSYENFTLEPTDIFRVWIELYMNGTWKPLVSKQQFMDRLHPDIILDDTEGPPLPVIPSEMWLFFLSAEMSEFGGPEIGSGTLIFGNMSGPYDLFGFADLFLIPETEAFPNLLVGEVMLLGDQVPVAEGIRVWIQRYLFDVPDLRDNETFTFQVVIQGFGEGATENIEEILTDPNTGLVEIKKEIQYIEGNITDPETGLVEIKSEIKSIEEKQDTIIEKLNELLDCCKGPVGGLIVSIYPSSFIDILPFSMGLAAGLASLVYLKRRKPSKED
jgi:hypothetical protein